MGPGSLKQIEAAKTDTRWDVACRPASRTEVPVDVAAALEEDAKAKAACNALNGSAGNSVLYWLH